MPQMLQRFLFSNNTSDDMINSLIFFNFNHQMILSSYEYLNEYESIFLGVILPNRIPENAKLLLVKLLIYKIN